MSANLAYLEGCKRQADIANKKLDYNQQIVDQDNLNQKQYEAQLKAWNAKKQNYDTAMTNWTNKTGVFAKFKDLDNNSTFFTNLCYRRAFGCKSDGIDPGISTASVDRECFDTAKSNGYPFTDPEGVYYDTNAWSSNYVSKSGCSYGNTTADGCFGGTGNNYSSGWKIGCMRNPVQKNKMQNDYNNAMPIFTDPKPTFTPQQQDLTQLTISCCQNVQSLAPNSNNCGVIQSCVQQINNTYDNLFGDESKDTPFIPNVNCSSNNNLSNILPNPSNNLANILPNNPSNNIPLSLPSTFSESEEGQKYVLIGGICIAICIAIVVIIIIIIIICFVSAGSSGSSASNTELVNE